MNKQIEEMRKDIYECDPTECYFGDQCEKCPKTEIAKALYDKGYRRQDEIAREIFEEIENNSFSYGVNFVISKETLAELKKKYGGQEDDD